MSVSDCVGEWVCGCVCVCVYAAHEQSLLELLEAPTQSLVGSVGE